MRVPKVASLVLALAATFLAASWAGPGAEMARAALPEGFPVFVDSVSIAHSSPKGVSASLWFGAKAVPDLRWSITIDRLGQSLDPLGSLNVIYVVPGSFIGWKGYLSAGAARYFKAGRNEAQVALGARILWFYAERVFPLDTGNDPFARLGVRFDL